MAEKIPYEIRKDEMGRSYCHSLKYYNKEKVLVDKETAKKEEAEETKDEEKSASKKGAGSIKGRIRKSLKAIGRDLADDGMLNESA